MQNRTIAEIQRVLLEYGKLADSGEPVPQDYASTRECILLTELQREVVLIDDMLDHPETFIHAFTQRCRERASDFDNCIPLSIMPESPANRMYWEIANIIFAPKNLKLMLEVVLPNVSKQVTIRFPDQYPSEIVAKGPEIFKKYVRRVHPYAGDVLLDIDDLMFSDNPETHRYLGRLENDEPTLEAFCQYAVSDTEVFDMRAMLDLNLAHHSGLQQALKKFPLLYERVYSHHPDMDGLCADIEIYNEGVPTPRTAIELLVKSLIEGGTQKTGSEFALETSIEAAGRFVEYFDALPKALQEKLRMLAGERTLGEIFDLYIAKQECVEETARHLNSILQQYPTPHLLLDTEPAVQNLYLKKIRKKYDEAFKIVGKKKLPIFQTRKVSDLVNPFPPGISGEVISRFAPNSTQELTLLMINLPPSLYDAFWQHATIRKIDSMLVDLTYAINNGLLHSQQLCAFTLAIINNYTRFNTKSHVLVDLLQVIALKIKTGTLNSTQAMEICTAILANFEHLKFEDHILFWCALTNNMQVLKHVIASLPQMVLLKASYARDPGSFTLLHCVTAHCSWQIAKTILLLYPENQRLALLKEVNHDGENVVMTCAAYNPVVLGKLFEEFKDHQSALHELCFMRNKNGKTALHLAAEHNKPESMQLILNLYQPISWLEMITDAKQCKSVLFYALKHDETINKVLELFAADKELFIKQLFTPFNNNKDILFCKARKSPQGMKKILELLSTEQKQALILYRNQSNATILHLAAFKGYAETIKICLQEIKSEDRLALLTSKNIHGKSPLTLASDKPDCLAVMLESLPESDLFAALKEGAGNTEDYVFSSIYKHIRNKLIDLNQYPQLKKSFLADFCTINIYLDKIDSRYSERGSKGYDKTKIKEALLIMEYLEEADSFDDIKQFMLDFLNHPNRKLKNGLLKHLLPDAGNKTAEEKIALLHQRWNVRQQQLSPK